MPCSEFYLRPGNLVLFQNKERFSSIAGLSQRGIIAALQI